jgi:hypothetical protein
MIPESGWKATSGVLDGEAEFGRYGYNANTADRLLYVPHGKAADAAEAILLCRQQGIIRSKLDAMEDGRRQRCVRYDAGDGDTAELRARKTEFILKSGPKRRSRITSFLKLSLADFSHRRISRLRMVPQAGFLNARSTVHAHCFATSAREDDMVVVRQAATTWVGKCSVRRQCGSRLLKGYPLILHKVLLWAARVEDLAIFRGNPSSSCPFQLERCLADTYPSSRIRLSQ